MEAEQEQRPAKRLSCVSLPRLLLFLCLDIPASSPILRVLVRQSSSGPRPGSLEPAPVL